MRNRPSGLSQHSINWSRRELSKILKNLKTHLILYSHICYLSRFLETGDDTERSPLHNWQRQHLGGHVPTYLNTFSFSAKGPIFAPSQMVMGRECLHAWMGCSRHWSVFLFWHLSVSGRLWVETSRDKLFCTVGKDVKQKETLPCLLKDHSAITSIHSEYSTFPCAIPNG